MESLKARTLSSHRETEKYIAQKIKRIRSVADYIALLQIFYTYFGNLERKIEPFLGTDLIPDIGQRRHVKRLAEDIASLGGTPTTGDEGIALPHIQGWQEAIGALYVVEGSTLGGKFIIQLVAKQAEITEGFSFFSAYGEHTAQRWEEFKEIVNAKVTTQEDMDRTVAAADETFAYFTVFIKQHG